MTDPVPHVLSARYASEAMNRIWSPEHKVVLERRLDGGRGVGGPRRPLRVQEELAQETVSASAGGGVVTATVSGGIELKEIAIEQGQGPESVPASFEQFLTTGALGKPKAGARKKLGLDDPIPLQFARYLGNAVKGFALVAFRFGLENGQRQSAANGRYARRRRDLRNRGGA